MSSSQRFCLRWNNHQSNLLSVFEQLLQDESFVDVTLAVEGLYLKAHKMVLSACSPYFQTLFVNNPDKHPIVFLKDVPYSDMRSLLDFMYKGEVSVDQERLTAFLKVAESLRIKGLTEVNEEKCDLPSITSSLLSSVGSSGDESRHPGPLHLMGHKRQSSSPSPLHHLHHSSMATYPPKRKRGRPRKLSGCELEASSLVGVVVGANNNNHLSDIDLPSEKGEGGVILQGPPELLETRVDPPHMTKDRHMSPNRASPAHHLDRSTASRSPDDLQAHKDLGVRKIKEEHEPTPGPSSHDPTQGYSRTSNSQDSDGGGAGSGSSIQGGSYNTALEWQPGDNNCWTNEETIITPVYHVKKPVQESRPLLQQHQQPPHWSPQPSEENSTISNSQLQDLSGKRQWSCELCGSQFTLQSSYSRHIKYMHSSHRSYICLLCGANFKRKDNLASHLKHRHMDKTS